MLVTYVAIGIVCILILIIAIKFIPDLRQKHSIKKITKTRWLHHLWGIMAGALSAFGSLLLFHRVLGIDSILDLSYTLKGQTLTQDAGNVLTGCFCLLLAYTLIKRYRRQPTVRLFDLLFLFGVLAIVLVCMPFR